MADFAESSAPLAQLPPRPFRALRRTGGPERDAIDLRAEASRVLLLKANEKDLAEVPPEAQDALRFRRVETVDEILAAALEDAPPPVAAV